MKIILVVLVVIVLQGCVSTVGYKRPNDGCPAGEYEVMVTEEADLLENPGSEKIVRTKDTRKACRPLGKAVKEK